LIVPATLQSLAFEPNLFGFILPEQVQTHLTNDAEIAGGIIFPHPSPVFAGVSHFSALEKGLTIFL
jgi:hypothetical protein